MPPSPSKLRNGDSGDDQLTLPLKRWLSVEPSQTVSISLAPERLDVPEFTSQPPIKKARLLKQRVDQLTRQMDAIEGRAVEQAARDAVRIADLELQLRQAHADASGTQKETVALKSRCELLEKQLERVRQDQLATLKENEKLKRMVDGAYLVPSLKDAFVQIDALLRGLVDLPVEVD